MSMLVIAAEAASALFLIVFCLMLASDGLCGPVFEIRTSDPVGRFLIRNAQVALAVGYAAFFASTAAIALGLL